MTPLMSMTVVMLCRSPSASFVLRLRRRLRLPTSASPRSPTSSSLSSSSSSCAARTPRSRYFFVFFSFFFFFADISEWKYLAGSIFLFTLRFLHACRNRHIFHTHTKRSVRFFPLCVGTPSSQKKSVEIALFPEIAFPV